MAAPQPGVWGIDLGQCALKAVRLQMVDGAIKATAFDYIEHPKILSQPDADPDQLTREALQQFLSRNTLKGDMVVISIPGQSGLARFVKLPPVEEKKIADIVKFEAKQQIPFPLEEVVWDFQKIGSGEVTDGLALETEIGLFAIKRDMVNRALTQFKDVNVEVHVVQMTPLALCNYVAYDLLGQDADAAGEGHSTSEKQCVVALDIGTDNSNLVITDGGRIIWQRPIPLGGNHFTRALTKDLKLTFAKAEHLKRNAAKSPDLKKILASLRTVLNDFVGEVQRSLGYFTNTHRDAEIQYMVGLGNAFRLPGLQKYLQEKLQLEVRKVASFERVTGEEVTAAPQFTENVMSFAAAYGLALQGLKKTRLQTNLLPYEVRMERIVRGKKPWAVMAAAALLLAAVCLTYFQSVAHSAVSNPSIKAAIKEVEAEKATADQLAAKRASILEERKKSEEVLRRLQGGVEERFNWQLMTEYVNLALPLPNGERLTQLSERNDRVKLKYDTGDARKAFMMLEKKRYAKPDPNANPAVVAEAEEFIKKNLIQISVEGISAMYTEDVPSYFKNIQKDTPVLRAMTFQEKQTVVEVATKDEGKDKIPQKCWVVEVRGYTYHKDGEEFIDNTLKENLMFPEKVGTKLTKEMTDVARKNVSFLFIYKNEKVSNPIPGQFQHISTSYLPKLLAPAAAAGGPGDPAAPGGMPPGAPAAPGAPGAPGADAAAAGPNPAARAAWKPIGENAGQAIRAGGPAGFGGPPGVVMPGGRDLPMPPMADPKDPLKKDVAPASAVPKTPRWEFVLLFIWKEPAPGITDAATAEAKKN
jgi:type IV pilus assembly protein PilM